MSNRLFLPVIIADVLIAILWFMLSQVSVSAQMDHDWTYPFCGPQPYILAIFDHSYAHGDVDEYSPGGSMTQTVYTGDARGGCGSGNITENYVHPETKARCWRYSGHNGWDYYMNEANAGSPQGYAPVYAVAGGEVLYSGYENPLAQPGSLTIRVLHEAYDAEYLHLSSVAVSSGDSVDSGQVIGVTGVTGASGYPHLHFSAREHEENSPSGLFSSVLPYFDPYGWDRDWSGAATQPSLPWTSDPWPTDFNGNPPPETSPSGPAAVSAGRRLLLPGAPDSTPCGLMCPGQVTVDDDDPAFSIIMGQWGVDSHIGYMGRTHLAVASSMANVHTAEAEWNFGGVSASAVYAVEVFIPEFDGVYDGSRAARYTFPGSADQVVLNQFERMEYGVRGRWVFIGYHQFGSGVAKVRLNNDASIGDAVIGTYVEIPGYGLRLFADAMRITPMCGWTTVPGRSEQEQG